MDGEQFYPQAVPLPEQYYGTPGVTSQDAEQLAQLLNEFIVDDSIPEHIRDEFMHFGMISRHLIFGNLDKDDIIILLRKFFIIKSRYLNSMPSYKIKLNLLMKFDNLEMVFRSILTRAIGPTRERVLQSTQIRQQISTTDFGGGGKKPGFFGRLLGFKKQQPKGGY